MLLIRVQGSNGNGSPKPFSSERASTVSAAHTLSKETCSLICKGSINPKPQTQEAGEKKCKQPADRLQEVVKYAFELLHVNGLSWYHCVRIE